MGMFNSIKSAYKKSEAAVVVQNLLEHQARAGWFEMDPPSFANKLVALVWEQRPDVFDGKFGQIPHKIAVAASALVGGTSLLEEHDRNRNTLVFALGNILAEIKVNGTLYPFNKLDYHLLKEAAAIFAYITKLVHDVSIHKQGQSCRIYETFEEWYNAFKMAAGEANPQLQGDENNKNLLDFMEHEPLKRAYRDKIEPESLARDFAKDFDIRTFGRR